MTAPHLHFLLHPMYPMYVSYLTSYGRWTLAIDVCCQQLSKAFKYMYGFESHI